MNRRTQTLIMAGAVTFAAVALMLVSNRLNPPEREVQREAQAPATERGYLVIPALDERAQRGADLFTQFCASCHGSVGDGSEQGPPLVHRIYEPSHHSDEAFYAAALLGVRQHHWDFGDMPKVEGIEEAQVGDIVAFVRRMQVANGIE